LMINIKSLLRRSNPVFQNKFIKHKNITMDLATYKVFHGQKQVHFGPTEFKLLQLFMTNPDSTYSRRQIVDYVWGVDKAISFRTVDVHINRIRKMMDLNDGNQTPTETAGGIEGSEGPSPDVARRESRIEGIEARAADGYQSAFTCITIIHGPVVLMNYNSLVDCS
ncbi:hypothetical protein Vafri_12201, partial [Volvox africanus]